MSEVHLEFFFKKKKTRKKQKRAAVDVKCGIILSFDNAGLWVHRGS